MNTHHNNNHQASVHNGHNTNANADVAASLRQSLPTPTTSKVAAEKSIIDNTKPPKPKKINPKMVKKYSGRGLKTITISAPGMRAQKFKVCVGNHPEDIQKWIEERKKRFPRMDGSHLNNNGGDSSGKKRGRVEEEQEKQEEAKKKPCLDEKANSGSGANDEGAQAGVLSSLLGGYASSSSEDANKSEPKGKSADKVKDETAPAGAAPSSEGDGAKSPAALDTNNPQPTRICSFFQRGKCRHGTSCKFLHSDNPSTTTTTDPDKRLKKRQSQSARDKARIQYEQELQVLGLATPSHGSRYTTGGKVINNTSLLHQLLQRDKGRERRMTLQLLRYIVDCDYFQAGGGDANNSKSCGEEEEDGEVVENNTIMEKHNIGD